MSFISKSCRLMFLHVLLVILLFLSGCTGIGSSSLSTSFTFPALPIIRKFDLSARQGLRDRAGDFSVHAGGADTGIAVLPGEKVEIFASGSASVQPGGKQAGPEGVPGCSGSAMPEPSLPCYSVIYSVGIGGHASEVGRHAEFNPATIGDLFLGINASDLASNAGSFQIRVLVIPPGKFAGLWNGLEDKFIVQGTSMTLSVQVFAQNATVEKVQFTVTVPGQAAVTACETIASGVDTYTCVWDFRLNGNYLHNGQFTLGFILNGSSNGWGSPESAENPDGIRTGVARYVVTQPNGFYAGYAATDLASRTAAYQKVTGHWTVPKAHCTPGTISLAAVWVGITSDASDRSLLAQLGTVSGCDAGTPSYFMWWEMFPAPSVPLDQPLQAGDSITASVTFQQGRFQLTIDNPTEGVHFSTTHPGTVTDTSVAECIVEAPTIIDNPATGQGHIARLTNFGKVRILCQLNDHRPIGDGPQDIIYQMNTQGGNPKATTSGLDAAGSTFTVYWHHG
jgi:Peptidase A4 family